MDCAVQVSADAFYHDIPAESRQLAQAVLRATITFSRDGQPARRQVTRVDLGGLSR